MTRVLHVPKITVLYAFFVFLKSTHCTPLYVDLDVTEYCDNQETLCHHIGHQEHVVCQYYGKTGASCSRFQEVTLDMNDAIEILGQINHMRSQAARGLVIGKDQQHLPQAYGMMEVSWDNKLASIARIMIKQCLDTHTHGCAATENFTDPIMAFMFDSSSNKDTHTIVVADILAMWDTAPNLTTSDQILSSPDLKGEEDEEHRDSLSLFYLKMMTGDATHVGCAAAIYDSAQVLSAKLFCYLSHYAKKDMPVYNTTKPLPGTMYTKCGCPPKYRETKACLCVPAHIPITEQTKPTTNQPTPTKYHKPLSINSTGKATLVPLFNKKRTTALWKPPPIYFTDKPQVSIIPIDWTSTAPQMRSILEPKVQEHLRLAPQQILEPIVQNNMRWAKQQVLEPILQKNEKWTLQLKGTQSTPIPKAGKTPSNCNTEVNCPPKIVMLPVFSLQNIYKHNSRKRGPRLNRRFGNTNLVQSAIADDDFSFSEEDEIPQNLSKLRSKLLQTVQKMRKNDLLDFFSQERNLKPVHRRIDETERNQSVSEPPERNQPSEHNLEFIKHILEPNLPVQTMISRSHGGRYEQSKKRAMSILNQMEKNGQKARLNSREILQFDAKMRRIFKTVMSTRDQMQF